jgi:hypothetical protein
VEHGTRACELTQWHDGNILDTLAAALAECGRFAEAVEHAQKAEALAPENLRADIRAHVQLFRSGKPFRNKPATPPGPSRPLPPGKRKRRR